MLCSICKKKIDYDIKFEDLLIFKFICKKCHEMLKEKCEVIPLDYGYNLYNYYYMNDTDYSEEFEPFLYEKVVKLILKNKDKIIIFSDEFILPILPFLSFKNDIIFISFLYTNLFDIFMLLDEGL